MNKGGRPCKLTPLQEMSLYSDYKSGKDITTIAYEYKVSYRTVSRIAKKYSEEKGY